MNEHERKLHNFIDYYQDKSAKYIAMHNETFEGKYFQNWYVNYGQPLLSIIKWRLKPQRLDSRIEGFTELYICYLNEAWDKSNEDLILESLFTIPEKMLNEFSLFGFI